LAGNIALLQYKLLDWRSRGISALGAIGVCAYFCSLFIPFFVGIDLDVPLIVLALISILATVFRPGNKPITSAALTMPLFIFLAATGLSILFSEEMSRSGRLSVSFLPGLLLFFIVADHFEGMRGTRLLYICYSSVALGLAAILLGTAWMNSDIEPSDWVSKVGSPLLVVPNDVTLLSLIAPLSLTLFYLHPRSMSGVIAVLSLVLGLCTACVFQSRVALLTLMVSVSCTISCLRPRLVLPCGLTIFILVVILDGFLGFRVVAKCIEYWDGAGRIPLWLSAWSMFLDAPLLGHGPHSFLSFYQNYLHRMSFPDWLHVDPRVIPWAHNLYIEILAEQGIVGLLAFGYLLACVISKARRILSSEDREVRVFGAGVLGGLISFCIAAGLELTFLRLWVVVVFFSLLGVVSQLSSIQTTKGG